jgi:ABC-type transport system involved in multi-copper enzyme maturation permease subunit
MSAQLRSEWRKVFTIRLWWGMLLGAVAFAALGVVAQIASNGARGTGQLPLGSAQTQQSIFASAASGLIFALIVGIILITTEYRHFTSRPTFLIEPRRGRVIVAKIVVSLAVGLLYGLCCAAIAVAIAVPWLSAKGVAIGWVDTNVLLVLLGDVAVSTVFAVLGLGVGVLARNQITAVIGALAYLFVLEPLAAITPGIKEAYRFLPGAAGNALTEYGTSRRGVTVLLPWQGGLVLLGWGLLFAGAGWFFSVRRDVD